MEIQIWLLSNQYCFSCGSMYYHLLMATTINNPYTVTPELSIDSRNLDLLEATTTSEPLPTSSKLFNHHWIEKYAHLYWFHLSHPTPLLYVVLVSKCFRLEPWTNRHEHYNNISSKLKQNMNQNSKLKINHKKQYSLTKHYSNSHYIFSLTTQVSWLKHTSANYCNNYKLLQKICNTILT